jgi:hypothetical protein
VGLNTIIFVSRWIGYSILFLNLLKIEKSEYAEISTDNILNLKEKFIDPYEPV